MPDSSVPASGLQLAGALAFGVVVGWYFYYVNRHRKDEVKLSDLASVLAAIGGAAVLALFPARTDLFGAYGVGVALGFFLYFAVLCAFVARSDKFGVEWFLDGRRKKPDDDEIIDQSQKAMTVKGSALPK